MRRRHFIKVIAGSAASRALGAHAQQLALPVVGFLHAGSSIPYARQVSAFRQGLSERPRLLQCDTLILV